MPSVAVPVPARVAVRKERGDRPTYSGVSAPKGISLVAAPVSVAVCTKPK